MAFIRTIEASEAGGELKRLYESSRTPEGGLYETTRLLSLWPEALATEGKRYQAVMRTPSALSPAFKETIACVVSAANRCHYCIEHHLTMLVEAGIAPDQARRIARDHRDAGLEARQVALLDFIGSGRADQSTPEAVDALRGFGWEDREILEAVMVAGLFHDYNLRVSLLGLALEDWFEPIPE